TPAWPSQSAGQLPNDKLTSRRVRPRPSRAFKRPPVSYHRSNDSSDFTNHQQNASCNGFLFANWTALSNLTMHDSAFIMPVRSGSSNNPEQTTRIWRNRNYEYRSLRPIPRFANSSGRGEPT